MSERRWQYDEQDVENVDSLSRSDISVGDRVRFVKANSPHGVVSGEGVVKNIKKWKDDDGSLLQAEVELETDDGQGYCISLVHVL